MKRIYMTEFLPGLPGLGSGLPVSALGLLQFDYRLFLLLCGLIDQ